MSKRNFAEMEDITSGTLTVETGVIFYLLGNPVLVLKLAGENRLRVFTGGIETVADGEAKDG